MASGIGAVIAYKACIAGASGGCQAEIGTASAMAAGALVACGTAPASRSVTPWPWPEEPHSLVCDPVAAWWRPPASSATSSAR